MAASEGVPFSKTGGLADVVGALPQALAACGVEVAVVLPRYRKTKLEKSKELIPSLTVALGTRLHFPRVIEAPKKGKVRWIFVDYPPFFDRDSLYVGKDGKDYPDNPERFSLFSRAVLEIAKSVFRPDIIHCHDWQAGLTPVLLRTAYAQDLLLSNIPSVFTIHNLGYAGLFPSDALMRAGLGGELFTMDGLEFYGQVNFLKGALIHASAVSTVSRKYALEIQTPEYGFGLEGVLRQRAGRLGQPGRQDVDHRPRHDERRKQLHRNADAAGHAAVTDFSRGDCCPLRGLCLGAGSCFLGNLKFTISVHTINHDLGEHT